MSILEFVVGLVRALAWPVAVMAIVLMVRRPLGEVIRTRLMKVEGMGFKAEFDRARADVRLDVRQATSYGHGSLSTGGPSSPPAALEPALTELVDTAPIEAMLQAFDTLTDDLQRRLIAAGHEREELAGLTGAQLAAVAARRGVITEVSAEAVRGLGVLRNLAVHGRGEITAAQALDFLAMADAVLYSFQEAGRVEDVDH